MAKKKNNSDFKSVDKISKELDVIDNFVLKHWKRYSIFGIIIIIIVGVVLFYYEAEYTNSLKESMDIEYASTTVELREVLQKYPDAISSDFARLRLAAELFKEEKYTDALEVYKKEITSTSSPYALNLAKLNEGYIYESQGKIDEAVKQFETLAENKQIPAAFRCQASYSAGRLLNSMGKVQLAESFLKKAVAEKDNCQFWPDMAESYLNRIKK